MTRDRGGIRPLFDPIDPAASSVPTISEAEFANALDEVAGALAPPPDVPADEPFAARVVHAATRPVTQSEGSIVADMLRWLAVQPQCLARKVHQTGVTGSGEPDLDICWRGRAVKIEVKRPGQRPTRVQVRRLLQWRDAGALVAWVTSLDDLRAVLSHADDYSYVPDLETSGP